MTKSNERSVMTDAQALAVLVRIEQDLGSITENDATGLHRYLRARLASTSPAPDGWVLVPREATEDQLAAMNRISVRHNGQMYTAAIAAAPKPVVEKDNG